jgi:ABC-type Fe3+/spermidine/putrescine transport system ATPase subunit
LKHSPVLSLIDLQKTYGQLHALDHVSFEMVEGEIVAILGPSGSGKSTLLMVIAGLERPEQGDVLWKGTSLASTPPHQRGFGLMFQDFVLFPHMNVQENIAFGLRMAGMEQPGIRERVHEMLELVNLSGFESRDINTLSGGEQQRVALARALAPHPRLLMLDEPLGSVDRTLRERLVVDIRKILRQTNQTALYVTHDQEEAFTLADRVILMRAGKIEQVGTPQELYRYPGSLFVARFLGLSNLLPAQVHQVDGRTVAKTPVGSIPVQENDARQGTILLRPDSIFLEGEGECQIAGTVVETSFRGSFCRAVIAVGESQLTLDLHPRVDIPEEGESVTLSFDPQEAVQFFPESPHEA